MSCVVSVTAPTVLTCIDWQFTYSDCLADLNVVAPTMVVTPSLKAASVAVVDLACCGDVAEPLHHACANPAVECLVGCLAVMSRKGTQ